MSEIKKDIYNDINEVMYTKVLDNGLTVFINKKTGFKRTFLSFVTNFGAYDTKFIPIDEDDYIEVPYGVAHFLEHKMFEMPNGLDATNLFADYGADSNAYTGYNETAYIVSCTSNFDKILEILLDFVQTPYFTDENVDREKGIIIEELKMYQDTPSDRLYNSIMKNLYKFNGRRIDVIGTLESINAITKEHLYTCYNTFYHPKNMYLCISGDINVEKTIELIEHNQSNKIFPKFKPMKCKYTIENNKVYRKSGSTYMDIVIPRVGIAIKYPIFELGKNDLLKAECIFKIIWEYKFGYSSENYQYLLDEELLSGISFSFTLDKVSSFILFTANSYNPKSLINYLKKQILTLQELNIDETTFNKFKKGLLGTFIRSFDNVEFVSSSYIEYILKNSNIFEAIDCINNITIDDLKEFCKYFNEDSITYYIIKPKNIESNSN